MGRYLAGVEELFAETSTAGGGGGDEVGLASGAPGERAGLEGAVPWSNLGLWVSWAGLGWAGLGVWGAGAEEQVFRLQTGAGLSAAHTAQRVALA